jgi:hypothetical protein
MYSNAEYTYLKEKYGGCASWAIWDVQNQRDTAIIDKYVDQLSARHVFVALNISKQLTNEPWTNFRSGRHDRKLKYACNDTMLRGSYLTDLFKGIPEPRAFKIKGMLTPDTIQKHVEFFVEEMKNVKLSEDSAFVILGDMAHRYFDQYFQQTYKNKIIYYCHYSHYGVTDKEWTVGLWRTLNIDEEFESIVQKYKHAGRHALRH